MAMEKRSSAACAWPPAMQEAFDRHLAELNFSRIQWLLLGLITINGVMAFLGHELGPLGRLLPRTGQLMEFLVSPVLLAGLWLWRSRPLRERTWYGWFVVAAESFACAWYFFVALPVFGPTAVFALTIIALGVFVLVPVRVFLWLVLPATLFHIALAFFSQAPLPVKFLVILHGLVAVVLAVVAQFFLFAAKRSGFRQDLALVEETAALRRSNQRLESRCRDLQESTALAAHDLQGPLQSLVAVLRLAAQRKEWSAEPHASLLREATETCVGLLDLGGRLLNDYRAKHQERNAIGEVTGEAIGNAGNVANAVGGGRVVRDWRDICRQAVANLQGKMRERGQEVEWVFPEEPALVRIDPPTLRGALENLLDNAVVYSPRGSRITVRLRREEASWVLELEDRGPGFPEEERAQLFEKFYHGKNRPAEAPPSNGLGLWMAHQRLAAQGGKLLLAQSSPQGSVLRMILPAAQPYSHSLSK